MRIIVSLWNTIPSSPYLSWPCLPSLMFFCNVCLSVSKLKLVLSESNSMLSRAYCPLMNIDVELHKELSQWLLCSTLHPFKGPISIEPWIECRLPYMIYFVSLDVYMRISKFFVLNVDINLNIMAHVPRYANLCVQWPGTVGNNLNLNWNYPGI